MWAPWSTNISGRFFGYFIEWNDFHKDWFDTKIPRNRNLSSWFNIGRIRQEYIVKKQVGILSGINIKAKFIQNKRTHMLAAIHVLCRCIFLNIFTSYTYSVYFLFNFLIIATYWYWQMLLRKAMYRTKWDSIHLVIPIESDLGEGAFESGKKQ